MRLEFIRVDAYWELFKTRTQVQWVEWFQGLDVPFAPMNDLRKGFDHPQTSAREMLIEEIRQQGKPYGLIFDDISGGFTSTGRGGTQSFKVIPHLVYRVFPDGRPDETVRGVDIVGTPLTSFSKIIAAADDDGVFNGTCGAESGLVPVSAVAPSILVSEIEIEKRAKSSEQPPILPTPHHDLEGWR